MRGELHVSIIAQSQSSSLQQLLTIKQVATQLQVCTKTVRRLIKEHSVPVLRVGRQIRVPAQHVAMLIKQK